MNKCNVIIIGFFLIFTQSLNAQNYKYYIRANSLEFKPELVKKNTVLVYTGKDKKLDSIFSNNDVYVFEKAFPASNREGLQRVYMVESNTANLLNQFLSTTSHIFEYGEDLGLYEHILYSYPDDYGQTGGQNSGLNVNLDNLDFIELPSAWDILQGGGSSDINIGVSDGAIDIAHVDFSNKTTVLPNAALGDIEHGTTTSGIAAAQGDNADGITGICYNCSLISNGYGNYNRIIELSNAGAQIINCSWGGQTHSQINQDAINEAYDNGSIIVASSGNRPWLPNSLGQTNNQGASLSFPASYEHVISVGSEGHRFNSPIDSIINNSGGYYAINIKHHVGKSMVFNGNPIIDPNATYSTIQSSTNELNTMVDILAPGTAIFMYGQYIVNGIWDYNSSIATSPAAPHVSGVLGLMLSINSCLTFEEAESILKIGSTNIDNIQANQFAYGNYGSGSLNAYKAVKLVNDLISPNNIAYIENQDFYRWNFFVQGVSQNIVLQNQIFRDTATLDIVSKNAITIKEDTTLSPENNGYTLLKIDSNLILDSNCEMNSNTERVGKNENESSISNSQGLSIYPNPTRDIITISISDELIKDVYVYDITGKIILKNINVNTKTIEIGLNKFNSGIYLVKIVQNSGEIGNRKIIKY